MGVYGLNMIQETKQDLRVSVEENHLKPELLTHLLPVPALVVRGRGRGGGGRSEGLGQEQQSQNLKGQQNLVNLDLGQERK